MLALWSISVYTPLSFTDSTNRALGLVGIAVVFAAGTGAAGLSVREGLWKVKRRVRIEVSEHTIRETRDGNNGSEIPFESIRSIHEYAGGLVIRGGKASTRIAVPREVLGFDELKRQLSKFSTIEPAKSIGSVGPFLQVSGLITGLLLLFTGHNTTLILSVGFSLLLYQLVIIIYLAHKWRAAKIPPIGILLYVVASLAIMSIVYMRARIFYAH
jgi:hypothetical protein